MNGMDVPSAIHQENRKAWNQTADWYRARVRENIDGLRSGKVTLHPIEKRLISRLIREANSFDRVIHMQCSAGMDTVSLYNLGAREVVGVDISDDLISIASDLAAEINVPAEFIQADVLQIPKRLYGSADLVYTGKGAVHWMHDIKEWGRTVSRLLRPQGVFVLFDFHPMMWMFRSDTQDLQPSGITYFAPVISYRQWPEGHVGNLDIPTPEIQAKQIRPWPPSAVVQSLIDAGLTITALGEYPDTVDSRWTAYPLIPPNIRSGIATTYSVVARKASESQRTASES